MNISIIMEIINVWKKIVSLRPDAAPRPICKPFNKRLKVSSLSIEYSLWTNSLIIQIFIDISILFLISKI